MSNSFKRGTLRLIITDSSVTARVCKQIPVDSEMVDDVIQSSLCAGEIVKVSFEYQCVAELSGSHVLPRLGYLAGGTSCRRLRQAGDGTGRGQVGRRYS